MAGASAETPSVAESRLPMAAAVVVAIALTVLLPSGERLGPAWLLPVVLSLLLVALIVGDPGGIDRRSSALRAISIGLVSVLVLTSLWATIELIDALINGGTETRSAGDLLSAGAVGVSTTGSRSLFFTGSWTAEALRRALMGLETVPTLPFRNS
jgi:hypothetical protein